MKYKNIIIENALVILFGILIFYLDTLEFNCAYNKGLILFFSLFKTAFFLTTGFKKIMQFTKLDLGYHQFLVFISIYTLMIIFSFMVDFLCLYQIDRVSFTGIPYKAGFWERVFNFFYYSFLMFSNIGMATIIPETIVAKSITMFEVILSFVTIILFLSDFIGLKKSLTNYFKKNKK
ncbi:MAG TPA: ion transporter [Bacteroidia bacterium]|nr:ion transporter [Bacteroidia bacterium]